MTYCPECGTANSIQSTICTHCNTALPKRDATAPPVSSGVPMVPKPPPSEIHQAGAALKPLPPSKKVVVNTSAIVFCPECGMRNPVHNQRCTQCGNTLQNISDMSRYSGYALPAKSGSWLQQLAPPLRAAVIIAGVVFALQLFDTISGSVGFFFSAPFHVVAYFAQGLLVGRYIREDPSYPQEDYIKQGIISALWRIGIGIGIYILLLIVAGVVTFGGAIFLIPLLLIVSLLASLFNIGLTGLGAWIYGRTGGKDLVGISIGIIVLSTVGACGIIALTATILTALGVTAFYSVFSSVIVSIL